MKNTERDALLREIATEIKRLRDTPSKQLPGDAKGNLIYARNFLRSIAPKHHEGNQ